MIYNKLYEKLFYKSLLIRKVEEKIIELYPKDLIQSPVHLSIGQEHLAVALCENLNKDDLVFINYRGHAYYIAKNGPLDKFFAELFGKVTGTSKGKAGSMHLAWPKSGIMGASAVVGSTISHAVGYSMGNKFSSYKNLCISIFGDGATEQGTFHESLNFASLFNVPVIFLCENNNYAVHSHITERQSYNKKKLVNSYNIEYFLIKNTHDLIETYNHFNKILKKFRYQKRPIFIEAITHRYKEHVGIGNDLDIGYRDHKFYQKIMSKDPLNSNIKLLEKFNKPISDLIEKSVQFALKSKFPNDKELLKDVY